MLDLLHALMEVRPDVLTLAEWAANHPDKWVAAIKMMAELGGYTQKQEVDHNIFVNLHSMGDAQLMQAISDLASSDSIKDLLLEHKPSEQAQAEPVRIPNESEEET
jgi:hypothetical protein